MSMIGRVDNGADAWDRLLQHLFDALLERHRGHTATLTATTQPDVDDVVFHSDQRRVAAVRSYARIDVVHKHGLDLLSQWVGRVECVRHVNLRWRRRVDDEARLEGVVAKVDGCALDRRQTLRIDQDPQPVSIDGDVALAQRVSRLQRHVVLGRTATWILDENAQRRGLRLTGEVADGWIPTLFSPEHMDVFRPDLEAGAKASGRSLDSLAIAPYVQVLIDGDRSKAQDALRPWVALYVGGMGSKQKNFYNDVVQRYGFGEAAHAIQDLYLSAVHGELEQFINWLTPVYHRS